MIFKINTAFLIGVLFVIFSGLSQAQEPLTKAVIERWISSQKEITQWGKKHENQIQDGSFEGMPPNAEAMIAPVKAAGLYGELENILEKYGFSAPEKWADATLRIMQAIGAIQMGDAMKNVDMQAQINEIKNNPHMSEEQKQQMIEMMQQSMGTMKQMANASKADISAVKPYVSKIMSVLEEQ